MLPAVRPLFLFLFFFNDTATTEIYTLSLHDALPISPTGLEDILARWGVDANPDVVQDAEHGTSKIVSNFGSHPAVSPLTGLRLQLVLPRPVSRMNLENPPADAPKVDELIFSDPDSTIASQPAAAPRRYPLMAAVEQKPAAGMANTRGTTRLIVAGDSSFLGDQMIGAGANLAFVGFTVTCLMATNALVAGL